MLTVFPICEMNIRERSLSSVSEENERKMKPTHHFVSVRHQSCESGEKRSKKRRLFIFAFSSREMATRHALFRAAKAENRHKRAHLVAVLQIFQLAPERAYRITCYVHPIHFSDPWPNRFSPLCSHFRRSFHTTFPPKTTLP